MSKTLIKNALVVSMDEDLGIIEGGDVLIEDDKIAAVGRGIQDAEAETIDGVGRLVMPGLIDGHRHMFGAILRGGGVDAHFTDYFAEIVQGFGAAFSPEDTYASVKLGAVESVDSGITTLHAWEHNLISPDHARASLQALRDSGLRARFSYGPPNDTMEVDLPDVIRLRDELFTSQRNGWPVTSDSLIELGIATRGVEIDRTDIWENEFKFAREHDLPITAHVMSAEQLDELIEKDALGPDLLAIHLLGAEPEALGAVVESGTTVCIAPPALARAGEGQSPISDLVDAGAVVALSVDSTAGCDTSDMFAVMRISMLLGRTLYGGVPAYRPQQVLRHATIDAARALGLGDVTGSLTEGKQADLIVLNLEDLNMAPLNVPVAQIVLCGQPRNVVHSFIDGRCVKRDGELVDVDRAECMAEATQAVRGIQERLGRPLI